ncbi:hypothetical protein WJX75_006773 [Coccomyxa subellipsoidea]|uniref:OCRE domain-containing protein n=1 Tax=Coccomyxa subellipsoidea TaxID=248742 RepID=A0ABR2YUC4_9CHLO
MDDDDLEGELTEGYRGAADIEDLLDDGLQQGPIKTTNPLFSAANRAARRKELNKLACSESGSFLEDVAGAEVEYGVHAQNWDNSGVPLEPFNLNQEREAGYFDEDGNYVAYCEAESDDAWLESLPQGPENAQAEEDMVEKDRKVFHDQEPQLSADTLRGYKEGIVDLLHPGESVFGALRRLGGLEGRKRVSDLRKDLGAGPMSARSMSKGRTVPPENRNAFDRLTALSNILLVNGDYHASTDGNAAANEEAIMKPEEATAALLDRSPSLTAEEETAIGTPLDASVQHHDPSEHATASLPGEQSCGPSSAETMDAEAVAAADNSGYFYNSIIGAYYDPYNRLFGDAASGHWFSLKNGEYQVVA